MLETLHSGISAVSNVLYQPWFVPLLLMAGGVYFTFRSKFIQGRLFKKSIKVVMEKPVEDNGVSSFGALMVSTASRVGYGKYHRCCHCDMPWRSGSGILDVG
ncbi:MAG: hypothetical protein V8R14_05830 [Clostridia bacterium]